jgi:hypothetical protein
VPNQRTRGGRRFVYQGGSAPELRGKYLFADFVPGRVFYADTKEMHSGGKLATIYERTLLTDKGQPVTMQQLVGNSPTDLRFGTDSHGELYVLSKANGKIWKIVGTRRSSVPTSAPPLPHLVPPTEAVVGSRAAPWTPEASSGIVAARRSSTGHSHTRGNHGTIDRGS